MPSDRAVNDRIVWIDCEMTGLSLEHDALIEVAALITDFELNQLDDGIDVVIRPPAESSGNRRSRRAALRRSSESRWKVWSSNGRI